jgi:hypothetical protein
VARGAAQREQLWRWLGISVGGTLLPFGILAVVFVLAAGHSPSWGNILGRGELFIPALIMNVETIWIWKGVTGWGRSVWYPLLWVLCGAAGFFGAVCFAVAATLQQVPASRVKVTPAALHQLSHNVVIFSLSEFLLALVLGTFGVVMRMLGDKEASTGE